MCDSTTENGRNTSANASLVSSNYETQGFLKHYLWFLCSIGLPGNILTILAVLGYKSSKPATLLIGCLAIFDSVALITKLVESQVFYSNVHLGIFGCKLIFVPSVASASIANWTLAFICAERCVAVCYPMKRLYMITTRRSKCILAVMSAAIVVYVSVMYSIFLVSGAGDLKCGFRYVSMHTFFLIQYSSHIIAPFLLINFCTVLVIRQLHDMRAKRKEMRRKLSINESPIIRQECQENKMSLLMIGASTLYFVVNAPSCLFYTIVMPSLCIPQNVLRKTSEILYVVNDSSHALNFFIYFILVKGFRTDLYRVIFKLANTRQEHS